MRTALAFDAPVAHRQDARAAFGQRGIVRDDDERRAVGVDAIEQRGDLLAGCAIELAGRLVGQQQARSVGQRARDRHALHLAARQLRRPVVGARGEPHVFEQLPRALPPLGLRHAGFRLRQLDVLGGGQHRQQEEALEDEADLAQPQQAALAIRERRHVVASEQQRAGGRRFDAAEHVQQRRLAAARRAANGEVIAWRDLQRVTSATAVTGPAGIGKTRLTCAAMPCDDVQPITSSRSVAAIGSRATIRIG